MAANTSSIPHNIRSLLPCFESPWRLSDQTFGKLQVHSGVQYRTCVLTKDDPEWNFILAYFNHDMPSNLAIKAIHVIHKARLQDTFQDHLEAIEGRAQIFPPT